MVSALDESVLNVTIALTEKNLINDTVIVFTTDNGGAAGHMELNLASNYPLKGGKFTVWEGGIRAVGFVYSDLISNAGNLTYNSFATLLNLKRQLHSILQFFEMACLLFIEFVF